MPTPTSSKFTIPTPSTSSVVKPYKNEYGKLQFEDYPLFIPNLTPKEIFERGSFGGTYWRPIKSSVTGENYINVNKQYEWLSHIADKYLNNPWDRYNNKINTYNVKVGSTLQEWESSGWINKTHPYGWVHWYCDFYNGVRGPDDERQVGRWIRTAGPKSRFTRALINLIHKNNTYYDDFSISPKRRQTLQHWGYILTEKDCV
jgi:hypothetical protein